MLKTIAALAVVGLALAGCAANEQARTDDAGQREATARTVNVDALDCGEKLTLMDKTNRAIESRYDQQDTQNGAQKGLALASFIFPPAAVINLAVGMADYSAAELTLLNSRLTASYLRHC